MTDRWCFGEFCRSVEPLKTRSKLCPTCRREARNAYMRQWWHRKYGVDAAWTERKKRRSLASYDRRRARINAERRVTAKERYRKDDEYRASRCEQAKAWYAANRERKRAYDAARRAKDRQSREKAA